MMDDAAMADTKKLAIVTGASQGLSEGIVQGFRARGHGVVATLRSIDPHLVTIAGDAAIRAASALSRRLLQDPPRRLVGEAGRVA